MGYHYFRKHPYIVQTGVPVYQNGLRLCFRQKQTRQSYTQFVVEVPTDPTIWPSFLPYGILGSILKQQHFRKIKSVFLLGGGNHPTWRVIFGFKLGWNHQVTAVVCEAKFWDGLDFRCGPCFQRLHIDLWVVRTGKPIGLAIEKDRSSILAECPTTKLQDGYIMLYNRINIFPRFECFSNVLRWHFFYPFASRTKTPVARNVQFFVCSNPWWMSGFDSHCKWWMLCMWQALPWLKPSSLFLSYARIDERNASSISYIYIHIYL